MGDLLRTGLSWLADELEDQVSQEVTYRRGADAVTLNATFGSQLLNVTDRLGNTKVERTDRDFLIRAADLVLSGVTVTPQRGDQVEVTIGSVTERFDVMAPGTEPPWRYSDPFKLMLRIHTRYIGTV